MFNLILLLPQRVEMYFRPCLRGYGQRYITLVFQRNSDAGGLVRRVMCPHCSSPELVSWAYVKKPVREVERTLRTHYDS